MGGDLFDKKRPRLGIVVAVVLIVLVVAAALFLAARSRGGAPVVGGGDFPYRAENLPPASEMFRALKDGKAKVRYVARPPPRGGRDPVLLRRYPQDYRRADGLSNHYTEDARIDCRFADNPTPREAWEQLTDRRGSSAALREKVYRACGQECNTFNPAYAAWIIGQTAGKGAKVLDPSAGWGDRLIGALAAGAASYHGFDPNLRLQEGYRRIVDDLGDGDHKRFRVTPEGFESAALPADTYDIALTSPPYFDLETYVAPGSPGAAGQSIETAARYSRWLDDFYRPYLANAYRAVRPGGWVVIYIEDIRSGDKKYRLRGVTQHILNSLGGVYAGRFGLETLNRKQKRRARTRWGLAWRKPT